MDKDVERLNEKRFSTLYQKDHRRLGSIRKRRSTNNRQRSARHFKPLLVVPEFTFESTCMITGRFMTGNHFVRTKKNNLSLPTDCTQTFTLRVLLWSGTGPSSSIHKLRKWGVTVLDSIHVLRFKVTLIGRGLYISIESNWSFFSHSVNNIS